MKAKEFKNQLKNIKADLRGKTLRLLSKNSSISYYTLKSFGEAVLQQESFGQSFSIGGVYTADGIVRVNSFSRVIELIKSGDATGVLFNAFYQPANRYEAMQSFGGLD
jgi:hypothetical protein